MQGAGELKAIFPDRGFYLEIQETRNPEEKKVNSGFREIVSTPGGDFPAED